MESETNTNVCVPRYYTDYLKSEKSIEYIFPYSAEEWVGIKENLKLCASGEFDSLENIFIILEKINPKFSVSPPQSFLLKLFNTKGEEEKTYLIKTLIPFIARVAMQVEELFPREYPLYIMNQNSQNRITLSRLQCLCLVTHMFFGTTMDQENKQLPRYNNYDRLLNYDNEIIKTIFHYFTRVEKEYSEHPSNLSEQYVSNIRLSKSEDSDEILLDTWLGCTDKLCDIAFNQTGSIEDHLDSINIDFANESLGGFFLCDTYTQEDIIFINSPELQPSLLFSELMLDKEVVLLVGAQRYAEYTGYLDSYKFKCNYEDKREIDSLGRKKTWISAIDAINFNYCSGETSIQSIMREINKAYIGFKLDDLDLKEIGEKKEISTGNWGTGVFGGDYELKFIIQWLGCSRAKRNMIYSSFNDLKTKGIPSFIAKFKEYTIGQLLALLIKNSNKMKYNYNNINCFNVLYKET